MKIYLRTTFKVFTLVQKELIMSPIPHCMTQFFDTLHLYLRYSLGMSKRANSARFSPTRFWPVKIGSGRVSPTLLNGLRIWTRPANRRDDGLAGRPAPFPLSSFIPTSGWRNMVRLWIWNKEHMQCKEDTT